MASKNDVTGDAIQTKTNSNVYRDNWDKIFSKKGNKPVVVEEPKYVDISLIIKYDEKVDEEYIKLTGISITKAKTDTDIIIYSLLRDMLSSDPHFKSEREYALADKTVISSNIAISKITTLQEIYNKWETGYYEQN